MGGVRLHVVAVALLGASCTFSSPAAGLDTDGPSNASGSSSASEGGDSGPGGPVGTTTGADGSGGGEDTGNVAESDSTGLGGRDDTTGETTTGETTTGETGRSTGSTGAGSADTGTSDSSTSTTSSTSGTSTREPSASCDELFGGVPGYILCAETEDDCSFNANTDGGNCDEMCTQFDSVCLAAFDNPNTVGMECDVIEGSDDTCQTNRGTELCVCAKP